MFPYVNFRLPLCRCLRANKLSTVETVERVATAQDAVRELKPGDRLHGYTVEKVRQGNFGK